MSLPIGRQLVALHADGSPAGVVEKLAAHRAPGVRHLAVSVVVRSEDGSHVLLQRRATSKYHFGGLWANTACTHPGPGETVLAAARRCLADELGIGQEMGPLTVRGAFWYRAADRCSGLIEHELDVVVRGHAPLGTPLTSDPSEVSEARWVPLENVVQAAGDRERYAPWLAGVLHTDAEGSAPAPGGAVTRPAGDPTRRRT